MLFTTQGSMFVSHPPSAYDLFLTAAVADGIKLWDLRTNRCVRRYDGHVNRSQPVGLDISPCARYIATGSEDRSVSRYLFFYYYYYYYYIIVNS